MFETTSRPLIPLLVLAAGLGGCVASGPNTGANPAPSRQMIDPGPAAVPEYRGGEMRQEVAGEVGPESPSPAPPGEGREAWPEPATWNTTGSPGVAGARPGDMTHRLALLERELQGMRGEMEELRYENRRLTDQLGNLQPGGEPAAPTAPGTVPPGPGAPAAPPQEVTAAVVPPGQAASTPVRGEQASAPVPTTVALAPVPAGTPQEVYDAAFLHLKGGQYDKALAGFNGFLQHHSADQLADNAQYWIGEIHYVQRRYPDALVAFNQVLTRFPQSDKVPASLLKIGFSFHELEDLANARMSLERLITDYPGSPAVTLAKQRLKVIKEQMAGKGR